MVHVPSNTKSSCRRQLSVPPTQVTRHCHEDDSNARADGRLAAGSVILACENPAHAASGSCSGPEDLEEAPFTASLSGPSLISEASRPGTTEEYHSSDRLGLQKAAPARFVGVDCSPDLPTTAAGFKQFVIDNVERSGLIHYALNFHQLPSQDIPVVVHEGKRYSLRISTSALDHQLPDDEENHDLDTWFRQISYQDGSNHHLYRSSEKKEKEQPDSFLPLGRLIEPHEADKGGRATNYVWAINISTDPWSLWLIYDYLSEDDLGFDCTVGLREIYSSTDNSRECRAYTDDKYESPFLGLKDDWDMLKVLNDVDDWNPENPCLFPGSDSRSPQQRLLGPSLRAFTMMDPYQP
ncbi:MAG: hypothetical protein Q9208_007255 [Pyrenodesmia sp. 3 TL-2023]